MRRHYPGMTPRPRQKRPPGSNDTVLEVPAALDVKGRRGFEFLDAETWTIEESCRLLGIGTSTGYRLVAAGEFPIPVKKIGNVRKILKSDMTRYLAGDISAAS